MTRPGRRAMQLGVCYYPEHWPRDQWAPDARAMVAAGITRVRIAEFAWNRIEPEPGRFDWTWLDDAVDVLAQAGLGIILCTPTATPPKWLVDRMPDMVALDQQGRRRGFGSRRHYCFSHAGYREEAARITRAMAARYGAHPAITAWQTDNEYGCHDTVLSYSNAARGAFRKWLESKYGTIGALNAAWGNVFWSMEYRSFDEVELPNLTVTEANPAHWLAFRRFSSEQVMAFDRVQLDILREASPGRDMMHNAMGFFPDYDHHDLGRQQDVIGWDSYPLGFLEMFRFTDEEKLKYLRQGHPDIAAFHHDLYRGCARDERWCVLEQQPGPVNWARHNPAPLPGMVRLWTLEAMAHGAEMVSYFRWRQAPFAQEQMHAGLLRPDGKAAPGLAEATQAGEDIAALGAAGSPMREVALVFAYDSEWVTQTQPQGEGLSAMWAAFDWYSALRAQGLNVDIVPPDRDLSDYPMVVVPCLPIVPGALVESLQAFAGQVVIGARSGSKTEELSIPANLAPGKLAEIIPLTVTRSESLRPGVRHDGDGWAITRWLDHVEGGADAELTADDGTVAVWRSGRVRYCASWAEGALLEQLICRAADEAGLQRTVLPEGMRMRRTDRYRFVFNYSVGTLSLPAAKQTGIVLGQCDMPPAGVTVLRA